MKKKRRSPNGISSYDRFMAKVDKNGENGCWNWMGSTIGSGYGHLSRDGKFMVAHHFLLDVRPTGNQKACHHCDNKRCVRPSHIFIGSHSDNMKDMVKKGRYNKGARAKTCKRIRQTFVGSQNGRAKLSESDAAMILALTGNRIAGMNVALAEKFGVTPSVVCAILHGRRWKHVQPDEAAKQRAEEFIRELRIVAEAAGAASESNGETILPSQLPVT